MISIGSGAGGDYLVCVQGVVRIQPGEDGRQPLDPSGDADFVFPIRQADLLAMSKLDMFSVLSDTGEVQWAFVKDPAAPVQAKYVASLKNMPKQTEDFMVFCNPK